MQLLTKPIKKQLIENHKKQLQPDYDPTPVVKYFTPDGNATWLITDMDPQTNIMFGLCDLGMGCPELGTVFLSELETNKGPFGLSIERDRHVLLNQPLSVYASEARQRQYIAA